MFLSKKKLASSAGNSVCPSTGSCVVYGRAGYAGGLRGRVTRAGCAGWLGNPYWDIQSCLRRSR